MAYLALNDEFVALMCNTRVLVSQIEKSNVVAVKPSIVSELSSDDSEYDPETENTHGTILCYDLSRCCRWIALCSSNKELSVWSCASWSLHSKRFLSRSAEKVKFTPSGNDLIVADKSGDAYLFSVQTPASEGKLLLGHLSMLLDVLVSDDEKFIISSDRDEKIRVSHFPNAYNIQSYCLGHKEFVSCLCFLPHDKSVLLSGSGDGHLRFWNYVCGKQLQAIHCYDIIERHCKINFIKDSTINSDQTVVDNEIICDNKCAVMHISCSIVNKYSLVGVSVEEFRGVMIFRVGGNFECIECSVTEIIHLQDEPWDICFSFESTLWFLTADKEKPLISACLDNEGKRVSCGKFGRSSAFNIFNDSCKWLKNVHWPERKCVLYKRKFDNLMDYAEKKKARLIRNYDKMD